MFYLKKKETLDSLLDVANKSEEERFRETVKAVSERLGEERARESGLRIRGDLAYIPKHGNAIVVGDLHGDLNSLERILRKTNFVERVDKGEKLMLVFLGDYIDRGPKQLEVLNMVLEMKRNFPENVVVLRGNHEVTPLSQSFSGEESFLNKLVGRYGYDGVNIYRGLELLFDRLPLAAKTENGILFVHGGVSEKVKGEASLIYALELREDLTWSDPRNISGVAPNVERGVGVYFGKDVLEEVLKSVKCNVLIRAHEPVKDSGEMFDGKLLTVFSSGMYKNYDKDYRVGYGYVSLEREVENVKGILQPL